jgi:hypothetical protein
MILESMEPQAKRKASEEINATVNTELNEAEALAWIAAFPDGNAQIVARWLLDHITHVTKEQFLQALRELVTTLAAQVGNEPYVVLAPRDSQYNKSETWVANLAVEQGLHEADGVILAKNIPGYLKDNPGINHIVLFDDASYSAERVKYNLVGQTTNLRRNTELKYYIVIPYMTTMASQIINESIPLDVRNRVIILNNRTIHSLAEIYSQQTTLEPKLFADALLKFFGIDLESDIQGAGLTYFDHKVPDLISLPEAVRRGEARNDEVLVIARHQFIPEIIPPYKR